MKLIFENFQKFLKESTTSSYKNDLKSLGIVPGATIYDYEFGDPPKTITIEKVDENTVVFSDSTFGEGSIFNISAYDALMAVKNKEWVPAEEFKLPSYFPDLKFPGKS